MTAATTSRPTGSALVTWFRTVAIAEAFSWAGLLLGMLYAYVISDPEDRIGIEIFGPIHGGIFVAYVITTIVVARKLRWSWKVLLAGVVASVPPFATYVFEVWAKRTGRLNR